MSWLKKPSTTGGIVYLVVLAGIAAGLATIAYGAWRSGTYLMGAAFGLAFVFRAILPDQRAGMLRVRRRFVDLVALAVCCSGMIMLATSISADPPA